MTLALPVGAGTETAISYQGSTPADYLIPQGKTISPDNRPDESVIAATYRGTSLTKLELEIRIGRCVWQDRGWHAPPDGTIWHGIAHSHSAWTAAYSTL